AEGSSDGRSKWHWMRPGRRVMVDLVAVVIHSAGEIERLRRAGRVAAATLAYVGARIEPGITTARIDQWVREDTARHKGKPSQLGYKIPGAPPFPAAVCTSRNAIVCHGIPSVKDV